MKQDTILDRYIYVPDLSINTDLTEYNVLNLLPSPVYICDKQGQIIFFNKACVQLWGDKSDLSDKSTQSSADLRFWNPDGTYMPPEKTPAAIAAGNNESFRNAEFMIEKADGSKVYVTADIDPLHNEKGEATAAIMILHDITKMKLAEKEIREKEKRFGKLIEDLKIPLYTTDANGRITLYNKAAADLWGREPEIGKDLWCGSFRIFRTDGTEMPLNECPMAVCLKEKRPVMGEEILVARPDGELRIVAPHPQPLFDDQGEMVGAVNMLVDITSVRETQKTLVESQKKYRDLVATLEKKIEEKTSDLQRKNEELKTSEERYHKMVDEVEDYAIILLDKNGVIQNWNRGAEKIKGYKESDIVGKSFKIFYREEDQKNGLPFTLLNEAKVRGKAIHEGWRVRKDGSFFWGSIVLTALHGKDNEIIGFSKVTRDLTERKIAEDRMKEYTNQLEFQNRELEQFAYAASHDMKEPLRKIHLYNCSVLENPSNKLEEKSKEYLSRSVNAVRRMGDLIEDLLSYSRATAQVDNMEHVNLTEIIEDVESMHKDDFEKKKARIEYENLPTIKGVEFQLKQLMSNLIGNSLKYRHPEKDTVVSIACKRVRGYEIGERSAEPEKEYHQISVSDNGIGFDPKYSEKVFDIFQRLNNLPGAAGSGIGLAICKKIVQNHKGFIKAKSKAGEGAQFDIFIPVEN